MNGARCQNEILYGISVRNASISSGDKSSDILTGVDLNVPIGCIYGLLGPSGCGKTTLLRCIVGCVKLDYGDVTVFGKEPGSADLKIPGPNVGYMPQEAALYFDLTIDEMLTYFARVFLIDSKKIHAKIDYLITVLDLPEKSRFISTLSGGQKRRVSFAAAIIHKPKLLILDEPTAGVDPLLREKIWLQLLSLSHKEKMTIIITTQYIEESRRADFVGFMRKGKIIAEGKPENLLRQYKMDTLENTFLHLCSIKRRSTICSPADLIKFKDKLDNGHCVKSEHAKKKRESYYESIVNWFTVFATIYWKNLLQDIRNPLTVSLQYLSPISQVLLFALCIGGNPFGIKIGIVNQDGNYSVAKVFLSSIDEHVIKQIEFNNMSEAMKAVKRREIWAVIDIPKNYSIASLNRFLLASDNISSAEMNKSTIRIHADLADKIVAMTTLRSLRTNFVGYTRKLLDEYDEEPDLANPIINIDKPVYGSKSKNYKAFRDFMLPGMVLNLTFAMAVAMSSLTLIGERRGQTFERNYVSGVSSAQILLSHMCGRVTLSTPYVFLVIYLPITMFSVPVNGSVFIAIALSLCQNIAGMTCGMLVAAVSKEIMMAMVVTSSCFMLFLFMSGSLWPLESIPFYFRWLCFISPTTLPTEAMRHILYRDWPLTTFGVWIGFSISFLWSMIFFVFSAKLFRYN